MHGHPTRERTALFRLRRWHQWHCRVGMLAIDIPGPTLSPDLDVSHQGALLQEAGPIGTFTSSGRHIPQRLFAFTIALIAEHNCAVAILALQNRALKVIMITRMVLNLRYKAPVMRIESWTLQSTPAPQA